VNSPLTPDNILHMAWSACVNSSKYDKSKWMAMEGEMMSRRRNEAGLLGRVGDLMREQNGDPRRIQKALAKAEKNARGVKFREEVENMRKVLGLPEVTG
jgi:hypothetical protein